MTMIRFKDEEGKWAWKDSEDTPVETIEEPSVVKEEVKKVKPVKKKNKK